MSLLKRLSTAAALALMGSIALLAQQPPATFRSGTQIVSLFVTVADAQKRLVPDLTQDDFIVFDNEKPQPIVYFDNSVHPITVVVMLDTSGSMTGSIKLLKQAAEQFILRLLPDDSARVGAFNDKIQFSSRFTNNRDDLSSDVKELDYGNGTRLWDAVGASLDELKGVEGRRVILVFTDGDDTESHTSLGNVIDRARTDEVMVYAIGLESNYFNGQRMVKSKPDSGLKICHPEIPAELLVNEPPRRGRLKAEIAQRTTSLGQRIVVGDDHSALACGDVLVWIEAERRERAKRSARLATVCLSNHLCRVLDDLETVPLGNLDHGIHVNRKPVKMDNHDCPGSGRDTPFDRGCVHVPGGGVAVNENRRGTKPGDCRSARDDGERRHDHFVARAEAKAGRGCIQRGRTVTDGDAVLSPNPSGESGFELADERPF